ncbi:Uncharacterised protein [Klebsiella michiganensis]|uniref:Uncharacterized protein n=1 Tax=Klebsiella michiganensis TaxID=1134687 RepID=A0A7H4MW47_9ENTR|nr:Uncharacterised protein [Klebsiella michiganensis]
MQFVYGVRVSGGFEPVCYQFAQWVVGDFNGQAGSVCENLTDVQRSLRNPGPSLFAGAQTQRVIYLREGYEHECFSPLSSSDEKFREIEGSYEPVNAIKADSHQS